jgi:hypothetical protein
MNSCARWTRDSENQTLDPSNWPYEERLVGGQALGPEAGHLLAQVSQHLVVTSTQHLCIARHITLEHGVPQHSPPPTASTYAATWESVHTHRLMYEVHTCRHDCATKRRNTKRRIKKRRITKRWKWQNIESYRTSEYKTSKIQKVEQLWGGGGRRLGLAHGAKPNLSFCLSTFCSTIAGPPPWHLHGQPHHCTVPL